MSHNPDTCQRGAGWRADDSRAFVHVGDNGIFSPSQGTAGKHLPPGLLSEYVPIPVAYHSLGGGVEVALS